MAEIKHNLAEVAKEAEVVEDFVHVESKLNPADIGNCTGVKLADLGQGSTWQEGPKFLQNLRGQ